MSERFTETQMYKLAEIYRDYECLWNVTSELYKDRSARDCAYQKILERLNVPGLSIKDIPKKIKNLRSSYYQEIKRIQNSRRSGVPEDAVYKPKVSWFTIVEGFLMPFRNQRETCSYNDKDSNSASDSELETQNTKSMVDAIPEEDSNVDESSEVDWGFGHAPTSAHRENENCSPAYFILPSKKQAKKRKDKKDDDIHYAIAKIDKIANRLTQNALMEKREDEFDTFGRYIAMALRSMPKELAIMGQTDIQKVISESQLRALRQNSEPPLMQYDASAIKLEYP
ncbi:uncharacterized protein LOC123874844 [Maniola jurtina]|uniref:uncharacterized protein LOC123874844 n=1 Tax=Maniola jurtina TaxID=191418 RepID=UPI001E68E521|nr:uncharacterized protein LOC123874844 [Maniola jurtina]